MFEKVVVDTLVMSLLLESLRVGPWRRPEVCRHLALDTAAKHNNWGHVDTVSSPKDDDAARMASAAP
jgi:hypothetical protein